MPIAAHMTLVLSLAVGGAVLVWVARAGASGRLRRNELVGIRTQASLASDEAWAAAHRAGARWTEVGGWCGIAAGAATLLLVPDGARVAVALIGVCALGGFAVTGGITGAREAKRVAPPGRATMSA